MSDYETPIPAITWTWVEDDDGGWWAGAEDMSGRDLWLFPQDVEALPTVQELRAKLDAIAKRVEWWEEIDRTGGDGSMIQIARILDTSDDDG